MWSKLCTFFFLSFFPHCTHSWGRSDHTTSNISVSFPSCSILLIFFFEILGIGFCGFFSGFCLHGISTDFQKEKSFFHPFCGIGVTFEKASPAFHPFDAISAHFAEEFVDDSCGSSENSWSTLGIRIVIKKMRGRIVFLAFPSELTKSTDKFHTTLSCFHDSDEGWCFYSAIFCESSLIWVS